MRKIRIAVCGFNHGRVHAENILLSSDAVLTGVVTREFTEERKQWAARNNVPLHHDLSRLWPEIDAVIIATPNETHREFVEECASRSYPLLIEKPLASTLPDGRAMVQVIAKNRVPALMGHHRRFSAGVRRLKHLIDGNAIGRPLVAHLMAILDKPDSYFCPTNGSSWRTRKLSGGGPLLINSIHEVDILRFLFGEWTEVAGFADNKGRGFEVEDTAVLCIRFRNGVLATINVTDISPSFFSYERTMKENPLYVPYDGDCGWFFGTEATLTFPRFQRVAATQQKGWSHALDLRILADASAAPTDPLKEELRHFISVARGEVFPCVTVEDGLRNLEAVLAVASLPSAAPMLSSFAGQFKRA
jgi:predicted dehydrogenase